MNLRRCWMLAAVAAYTAAAGCHGGNEETANDAAQGVDLLNRRPTDLLVADLVMPIDVAVEPDLEQVPDICPGWRMAPLGLDFGEVPVNGGASRTFTLTNTGPVQSPVDGLKIWGANVASFSTFDYMTFYLMPGQSREFVVGFQAGSAGMYSANLEVRVPSAACHVTIPLWGRAR